MNGAISADTARIRIMANKQRYRDDDFDDDEQNSPPPADSTGTIIGTVIASIFGVWVTVIGAIGVAYVLFFACVMCFFLLVFCILGSIMFTAMSRTPPSPPPSPPAPVINQPITPFGPNGPPFNPPPANEPPKPVQEPGRN
jgi:amino acid transporter